MTARLITHEGLTLCCVEWDRRNGWSDGTVSLRLGKGWSEADAVSKPPILCNRVKGRMGAKVSPWSKRSYK